jgi:hypothetical protein
MSKNFYLFNIALLVSNKGRFFLVHLYIIITAADKYKKIEQHKELPVDYF